MISDFGNVTSDPDLIKPPSRLPLPGDYLLAHIWSTAPLPNPLGKLKHLIIAWAFPDFLQVEARSFRQANYLLLSTNW